MHDDFLGMSSRLLTDIVPYYALILVGTSLLAALAIKFWMTVLGTPHPKEVKEWNVESASADGRKREANDWYVDRRPDSLTDKPKALSTELLSDEVKRMLASSGQRMPEQPGQADASERQQV